MARMFFKSVRVIVPLLAAFAIPSGAGLAWCGGPVGCVIDGRTRYNWAHTWFATNDLETPLNQYYIQRSPQMCGRDSYLNKVTCEDGVGGGVNQYGALPFPASAVATFVPAHFERLGKIPNEMDRIGGTLPTVVPAPTPRRQADSMLLPK